jgi:hypothetical protein
MHCLFAGMPIRVDSGRMHIMDGMIRVDETSSRGTPAGYFIAIIAVLGGTLLIPPLSFVFTIIGALLLLALILLLIIYKTRSFYSQDPVAVNQSSMTSGMCDTWPCR